MPMDTTASSTVSHGPPAHIASQRDRIYQNLLQRDTMPDFPVARIPSPMFNPSVHLAMVGLVAQRNKAEADLSDMVLDKAADGTLLDPNRDYEPAYQRLSAHINDLNRALYAIYAQYLDRPSKPYQQPEESSAHLALMPPHETTTVPEDPPCPYQHIAEFPLCPATTPTMATIHLHENTSRALFTRMTQQTQGVTALADSGASHVLLQASAVHILRNVEYSHDGPPFAILKAANHGVLTAIGRGVLSISGLDIMAYIFPDRDLTNNLLGLVPFANLGCTGVFKPKAFHIFKANDHTAILSGTRDVLTSLWRVSLQRETGPISDSIPPPHQDTGLYVEANAVSIQDNATYVRFVHACLGYPAPSTFLRAVSQGYITGPDQFPRLTTRMVRKHLPNSMATAKGHLDRSRSGQPHAESDAVSARRRHHTLATRNLCHSWLKSLDSKDALKPFDPKEGPRSTTLHLDYTGPLPEACASGTRYFQISCWGGYSYQHPALTEPPERTHHHRSQANRGVFP